MRNSDDDRPKRQPTGDYPVGYCRPPKETRWGPGESGNPRGPRRKRSNKLQQDITRKIRAELRAQTSAVQDGQEVRIDMLDFLAKIIVRDLVTGTPAQRLRMFKELMPLGVFQPSPEDYATDPKDRQRFLEKLASACGLEKDENGNYIEPAERR